MRNQVCFESGLSGSDSPTTTGTFVVENEFGGRRRTPLAEQACQMCRKKKIKCELDRYTKTCVQCHHRRTRCIFAPRRLKRESLKRYYLQFTEYQFFSFVAHRAQHIRFLEKRLKLVESLLRRAGYGDYIGLEASLDELASIDNDSSDGDNDDEGEDEEGNDDDGDGEDDNDGDNEQDEPNTRNMGSWTQFGVEGDEPRYFGQSSGLSILSQRGIQWVRDKTGDSTFPPAIFLKPWDGKLQSEWRPDIFHDLFSCRVFKALPPRAEVFELLRAYFRGINRLFPIYHEKSFMTLIEWQYTQQTCNDTATWASINILIAMAYRDRIGNSQRPEKDNEKAWLYFKNAASVLTDLILRRSDLLSIQALLGMGIFLRGNCFLHLSFPLVAVAIRACHHIGLHQRASRLDLSPAEREQRRRVFWTAFILDQSTSVRGGLPPAQDIEDFDVELPATGLDNERGSQSNNEDQCLVYFQLLCRLIVIKGRVYHQLYSSKKWESPLSDLLDRVKALDAELDEWRKSNPFSNESPQTIEVGDSLRRLWYIRIQLSYYHTVTMINRMPPVLYDLILVRSQKQSGPPPDPNLLPPPSYKTDNKCLKACRNSLKLLSLFPKGDIVWIWSLLYYIFYAATSMFGGVLRNPNHPDTTEDLQSLNMSAAFFATLLPADGGSKSVKFMATMCATFERIAKKAVEKEKAGKEQKARDGSRNTSKKSIFTKTIPKPDGTSASTHFPRASDFVHLGQPSDLTGGMKAPNTEFLLNANPFYYSFMGTTFNSDPSAGQAMPGVNMIPESGYDLQDAGALNSSFGFPPYFYGMHPHFTGPSVPPNPTPISPSPTPSQFDQMSAYFYPRGYFGDCESAASTTSSGAVLETSTFSNSNQDISMENFMQPRSWI
ncbi:Fungal specific transcription factor domain containing protein [Elaphomyces granulatus]